MAWYRPEQWTRLLEISDDREELEPSHDEWLQSASKTMHQLRGQGLRVEKVQVDVEDLLGWCNGQGRPVDGASRAAFVAELLRQRDAAPPGQPP